MYLQEQQYRVSAPLATFGVETSFFLYFKEERKPENITLVSSIAKTSIGPRGRAPLELLYAQQVVPDGVKQFLGITISRIHGQ
jgi:hypothetical protein